MKSAIVLAWLLSVTDVAVCYCGHYRSLHDHYRAGTDCALCDCPKFKRARRWRR